MAVPSSARRNAGFAVSDDGALYINGAGIGGEVPGGTAGRVLFLGAGTPPVLADSANLTFNGTTLTIVSSTSAGVIAGVGSVATPAYGFAGTADGLYVESGRISWGIGGTKYWGFNTAGLYSLQNGSGFIFGASSDVSLYRISAGLIGINTSAAVGFAGRLKLTSVIVAGTTIANLNAAPTAGELSTITDQLTTCPAKGVAPTAGGSAVCPVFYNGTAWVGT